MAKARAQPISTIFFPLNGFISELLLAIVRVVKPEAEFGRPIKCRQEFACSGSAPKASHPVEPPQPGSLQILQPICPEFYRGWRQNEKRIADKGAPTTWLILCQKTPVGIMPTTEVLAFPSFSNTCRRVVPNMATRRKLRTARCLQA
jgi:hypothetical protein